MTSSEEALQEWKAAKHDLTEHIERTNRVVLGLGQCVQAVYDAGPENVPVEVWQAFLTAKAILDENTP